METKLVSLPVVVVPPDLQCRISRRALACARRIVLLRRQRPCVDYVLVWPDLRLDAAGAITNLRFRFAAHSEALKLAPTLRQARLAAALEWHASECVIREMVYKRMGKAPLLSASDADLDVLLDRPPFDLGMSVWAEIAEKELKERENESAHRKLSRYEARMIWLAAQEKSN